MSTQTKPTAGVVGVALGNFKTRFTTALRDPALTHKMRDAVLDRQVGISLLIAAVATALSYVVASIFAEVEVDYLEAFAVAMTYSTVYLCVVERRFNYVIGAVGTASYALLFYQYGLVASTVLNLYQTPALLFGWYRWHADTKARPVTRISRKTLPVYIVVTVVAYAGAFGIAKAFDGELPLTDTLILIGSLLAQFLMDNKKVETWFVWAAVNVFAIYTYAGAGLSLAAVQYAFLLANAGFGFYLWRKNLNRDANFDDALGLLDEPADDSFARPVDPAGTDPKGNVVRP